MSSMKMKIKEEPPDEELSAILDNGIQLSSVDEEAEGLITQQIEEILPTEDSGDEEEGQERPKRKLPCQFCDFKAKTKKELGRHESRHAIKGWYHECQYCDYVTYIRQRLLEHESKHTNTKPFECEKCEFRTRFKADLYKHRAKHSTVKKFSCPKCDFRTKWCRNIKHHLLKHTEERPHCCEICGFKFKRVQDLKYHLYRHTDVKPIQCELCEFRCKTNYELKCHSLKHSNIKNFSCTFPGCTQKTKTKSDLTKHIRTHNKDKSYLCSVCGKGFNTLTSLNKHKDRHSNVRKFKCGLCEKWFKNKPSLRAHMKIHSGIKPFQCDVCFRYFLNKYNMHKHKETHTGDRPYLCPICPYGARISDHLLAHIGSMHGDSHAYFCELCRKPFKRYSQLQVHIKRMHKDVKNFDRGADGKLDIKLESGVDGVISTGSDVFSVKKLGDCHFEPEVKRKRGRPPKNKTPSAVPPETVQENRNPETMKPDKIKQESITQEESAIKLATYQDGFRLPLATKGFQFNFDKTGKKPRSWFMQPENMFGKAAVKQRAYMAKKERYFDRLNSGRIKRVRKKSDTLHSDLNMVTRSTAQKVNGTTDTECDRPSLEKEKEPHRLLITGRTKLITMRKIKRRIRNMKASLRGSSLLNDPIPAQRDDIDAVLEDEGEDGSESVTKSEDEDNLPLSELRAVGTHERPDTEHPDCQFVSDTCSVRKDVNKGIAVISQKCDTNCKSDERSSNNSTEFGCGNGSHIKLVLKRKKKGRFKVTLNTSAQVRNTPVLGKPEKKTSTAASDVYNGSVRILGKCLQSGSDCSPSKSLKAKSGSKRRVQMKESQSVIQSKKQKSGSTNKKCRKENTKVKVYKTTSKAAVGRKKGTKVRAKGIRNSNNSHRKEEKVKKAQSKSKVSKRGKPKSKQNKLNNAQNRPKVKKKNLICSIGVAKSAKKITNNDADKTCGRNKRFLQNYPAEEFPIKIEPADDEYESSIKGFASSTFMDVDVPSSESLVKVEACGEDEDHLPNCLDVSVCSCTTSVVTKEYREESELKCKYLYDVKPDINVDESYNEHAIAWGLNLHSKGQDGSVQRYENLSSPYCTSKNHAQEYAAYSSEASVCENNVTNSGKSTLVGDLREEGSKRSDELLQKNLMVKAGCATQFTCSHLLLKSSPCAKRGLDVHSDNPDLDLVDVKVKSDQGTHVGESVYCWGTTNHESADAVLPNTIGDVRESPPLDLRINRKLSSCGREAGDEDWMDTVTQDKANDEMLPGNSVTYTYTF